MKNKTEKDKKKKYNKYTGIADRFPFIIVAVILILTIVLFFQFKQRVPLTFFSQTTASTQEEQEASYSILITSPSDDQVFNFVNKNESVPIEIKSKEAESLNYNINLIVNGEDIIKTFSTPPYRYNWKPAESGDYEIVANLINNNNAIISSSNKINVVVNYSIETTAAQTTSPADSSNTLPTVSENLPTIRLDIYEGPIYSEGDDICYYRVEAIVTGDPEPTVSFSKDDSGGIWGPFITQVNLTRSSPNYTLTAVAKNIEGESTDALTLYWGCGPLSGGQ
jgi:hypothetical protein